MSSVFKRFVIFILPILALLVFQYLVDPLDIYSGKQLITPVHYRFVKTNDYLYHPDNKRDYNAFIFGTSRVMRLEAAQLEQYGLKAFNYGINMTRAEDYYCLLRLLLEYNSKPIKLIIIGLEPELLSNIWPVHRHLLQVPELSRYLIEDLPLPEAGHEDLLQIISDSLRYSFVALWNHLTGIKPSGKYEFDHLTGDYMVKEPRKSAVKVSVGLLQSLYNIYNGFTELHPSRIAYFDLFIYLCSENNIRVIGYVTANHPILLDHLRQNTQYEERLADAIKYWDSIEYEGFSLRDFTSVEAYGGDPDDFADLIHIGTYNAELVVRQLMEEYVQSE
ncbi:hypothetical protein KAU45_11415 [bacterium]|nr:hypothetical protein [bacterium]